MADARDSKSREGNFMWVRPPPPAPMKNCGILSPVGHQLLSEPDREQVAPRLWLEMTTQGHFLDASTPRGQLHVGSTPTTSIKAKKVEKETFFFYLNLKGVERAPKATVFAFARPGVIAEQPSKPY